jgi:hypothetical protein
MTYRVQPTAQAEVDIDRIFRTRRGRTYRALFVIRGDIVQILCVRGPGEKPVKPEDIEP